MKKITLEEFKAMHDKHQLWLQGKEGGERLVAQIEIVLPYGPWPYGPWNLSDSDLSGSDLRGSDLRDSNLSGSNLSDSDLSDSDLRGSDLRDSNLRDSDLSGSDLRDSDLRGSDLRGSDLRGSNLRDSDLRGSDLDFSSGFTFSCRTKDIKADLRIAAQMALHFCWMDFGDCQEAKDAQAALRNLANKMHRVVSGELEKLR